MSTEAASDNVRHIMPRRGREGPLCGAVAVLGGDHVGLCVMVEGLVVCEACLVKADELLEAGDIEIRTEGDQKFWLRDTRPPEYRSADAFADHLRENETNQYTPEELEELARHTERPEAELRRVLGQRGIRPAPPKREVRGMNSYWKSGAWRVH